jgi:integrase
MLSVYTRHYPPCRQTDSNYRRCRCPKWINGTLATGKFIRESAQTRSWETAERKARLMEIDADPLKKAAPEPNWRITIEQAVGDFLRDEEARKLQKTSTCQSKTLLEKQLLGWAREQSLTFLDELTTAKLREFRASWNNGALTTQRKHHRINGFFDFCIENDWLLRNPAKKMKPMQVSQEPTDYFTPAEFAKIVDATYAYGEWKGGRDFEHRSLRLRALILLMRWSGLSILDAVTLERRRLDGDRLLLYRHKTKVPVYVPLPPVVTALLETVQSMNEQVASNFDQQRMVAQLAGIFGLIAMLLAAIGLYGLTTYTVACRTSEIGVRMALGADRLNIVRFVLRGAFLLVAIGLFIGIPLAIGAGRLMAAQLFEIRSWDPHVFGFSILALGACAAVASILPAHRAASTNPMKALRTD